jgi:hypothetical protein
MGSVAHKPLDCRRRLAAVQGADRSVDEYKPTGGRRDL